MCCRRLSGGKQQSTGLLHLDDSIPSNQSNRHHRIGGDDYFAKEQYNGA